MSRMHDLSEIQGRDGYARALYDEKVQLVEQISKIAQLDEKNGSSLGFVELFDPVASLKVQLSSNMAYNESTFKAPDRLGFSASGIYVTGHSFSLKHLVVGNKVLLEVYPTVEDGTFQHGVIERPTGEISVVPRLDLPIFSSNLRITEEMMLEEHDERSGYETVYKYLILLTNDLVPTSVKYQSRINSVSKAIELLDIPEDKQKLLDSYLSSLIYDRNCLVMEYEGENPEEAYDAFKKNIVDIHEISKGANPITALIRSYREILQFNNLPESYRELVWDAFEVSKPVNVPEKRELFTPPVELSWNSNTLETYKMYFQRKF